MKTIYTFFTADPARENQGQLIRHFHNSWSKNGWDIRMLNPRDYAEHPVRDRVLKALESVGPERERLAFLKFLALVGIGHTDPVLFADYDVINFGLRPDHNYYPMVASPGIAVGSGICFIGTGSAQLAVERLLGETFHKFPFKSISALCEDFGAKNWEGFPLTHFTAASCGGIPKHTVVETCGRFY